MAISSCWLHFPKGCSLRTVHNTKTFFPLSGQGFTCSLCSPVSTSLCSQCGGSSEPLCLSQGTDTALQELQHHWAASPAGSANLLLLTQAQSLPRICLHQMIFAPFPSQAHPDAGRTPDGGPAPPFSPSQRASRDISDPFRCLGAL